MEATYIGVSSSGTNKTSSDIDDPCFKVVDRLVDYVAIVVHDFIHCYLRMESEIYFALMDDILVED